MNRHFYRAGMLFLAGLLAGSVGVAQTPDSELKSFGKRTPTPEELNKALGPSALQGMNIGVAGSPRVVKKAVDMDLVFPFGSAEMSPQIKAQLGTLGQYLQTAKLGPGEFRIEGHTDGVGTPEYNRALSERRALAVKNFLVSEYKINGSVLTTAGVGAAQLKDDRNPASEVNRRVEFSRNIKE